MSNYIWLLDVFSGIVQIMFQMAIYFTEAFLINYCF